jgi:transcriptional regulator GlxA family with amidase domain
MRRGFENGGLIEDTHGSTQKQQRIEVGYESPSRFNREYKLFFGQPPMRDIHALRVSG